MIEDLALLVPLFVVFLAAALLSLALAGLLAFYGLWVAAAVVAAVGVGFGVLARSAWRHRKEVPV